MPTTRSSAPPAARSRSSSSDYGEAEFRAGERRVIARLLDGPAARPVDRRRRLYGCRDARPDARPGASPSGCAPTSTCCTTACASARHRPLLRQGDPKEILARLMNQRYPIYAEADIVVEFDAPSPPTSRPTQVIEALRRHLAAADRPEPRHEREARPSASSLAGRSYDIVDRPWPDRSRRRA